MIPKKLSIRSKKTLLKVFVHKDNLPNHTDKKSTNYDNKSESDNSILELTIELKMQDKPSSTNPKCSTSNRKLSLMYKKIQKLTGGKYLGKRFIQEEIDANTF